MGDALYRLVIHDDPEHGLPFVVRALDQVLGIRGREARRLARALRLNGQLEVPQRDRAAAEAAFEDLLLLGPDPAVAESSGSLVVGLEVESDGKTEWLRRGHRVAGAFQPLDDAGVAALVTPLLEVHGRTDAFFWGVRAFVALAFFGSIYVRLALEHRVPHPFLPRLGPDEAYYASAGLAAGALLLVPAAARVLRPRLGTATFFARHVRLEKPTASGADETIVLSWSAITAFDDGAEDHIRLVVKTERDASYSTIPTPTEDARTAVLDLLISRGIPRRA